MKTAIILNGYVRTFEQVVTNFAETFSNLNPDIFVSTYNRRYGYHPHIQNITNFYTDEVLDDQQIIRMFNGLNVRDIEIEDAEQTDLIIEHANGLVDPSMMGLQSSYGQYRKMQRGNGLILNYERKHNIKYDRVIKTRCDLIHNKMDYKIEDNQVLVDSGNVFPNDCFIMSSRDNFTKISNFIMREFYTNSYGNSWVQAPHKILENSFKENNLQVVTNKIMMAVARVPGLQYY